jgi:hypothetical protein
MAEARRVNIGFEGGQVLSARLSEEVVSDLRSALDRGGWHDVLGEDGSALVQTSKIVYITTDSADHRVGFGV